MGARGGSAVREREFANMMLSAESRKRTLLDVNPRSIRAAPLPTLVSDIHPLEVAPRIRLH